MTNRLSPGAVRHPDNLCTPVVFEAHAAVYYGADTFESAEAAVRLAAGAIASGNYKLWHRHAMAGAHERSIVLGDEG